MSSATPELPLIDLSRYLEPKASTDQSEVIEQIRKACSQYGFFLLKGHGIPLETQRALFKAIDVVFDQPTEQKLELSFLKNPCRRGYEASGMSLRDGDALPDSKESYFIGREDPVVVPPGFYGPNVWPSIPDDDFRTPAMQYYERAHALGRSLWEILIQGLGHDASIVGKFASKPMVMMKMMRYPRSTALLPNQFGIGAHTDFGGVTILLQEPGREGLEVWHEASETWLSVPAAEDVLVINCGNIVHRWSDGTYKSALHRVVTKSDLERKSCAVFWHGDAAATNPLKPDAPEGETVGKLLIQRFRNQYSLPKVAV